MSATDALTITSALDALTRYYEAKEREESVVLYINDAYLEALNSLEKLESENAKLRELAHILCHCMQVHADCDDCRLNGAKGELGLDQLAACDGLHEMLRELGVET